MGIRSSQLFSYPKGFLCMEGNTALMSFSYVKMNQVSSAFCFSLPQYRRQKAFNIEIGKGGATLVSGNIYLYHISFVASDVFHLKLPVISVFLRDMTQGRNKFQCMWVMIIISVA